MRLATAVISVVLLNVLVVFSCRAEDSEPETMGRLVEKSHHPRFDLEEWMRRFPYEAFEHPERPRYYKFPPTPPGDPLDLRKPSGEIVSRPADLCCIEHVRRRVAQKHDLGKPVPVDLFLWSMKPPRQPYLTKLGGVPHREAGKPWPHSKDGTPYTFVAQFCFLDSKDISPKSLPDDVMLLFFRDAHSHWGRENGELWIEWSSLKLKQPLTENDVPPPSFVVPRLSGVILRYQEFPECDYEVFEQEGHDDPLHFPVTQSTKIGTATFFVQGDRRERPDTPRLICSLSSLYLRHRELEEWPFVDLKQLPGEARKNRPPYGWGPFRMMFADVGCMYFFLDDAGKVTAYGDSY